LIDSDPNSCALCFIREISNIEENISDSNVARFMDLKHKKSESGEKTAIVDLEAKQLLDDLKYKKIPEKLDNKNIFKFEVFFFDHFFSKRNYIIQ
jgi:hypothetical protein